MICIFFYLVGAYLKFVKQIQWKMDFLYIKTFTNPTALFAPLVLLTQFSEFMKNKAPHYHKIDMNKIGRAFIHMNCQKLCFLKRTIKEVISINAIWNNFLYFMPPEFFSWIFKFLLQMTGKWGFLVEQPAKKNKNPLQ